MVKLFRMIKLKLLMLEEKVETVVFHGSDSIFKTFDSKFIGSRTDPGFAGRGYYFTDNVDTAKQWGKYIYYVRIRLNNPLHITGISDFIEKSGYEQIPSGLSPGQHKIFYKKEINRVTDYLIKKGYDGIVWKMSNGSMQYVSYFPEQQCEILKIKKSK